MVNGGADHSPNLADHLASTLPGIDPAAAMLLMRGARLGRLVDRFRGQQSVDHGATDASGLAVLGALLLLGPPHQLTPTFLSEHVLQTSGGISRTVRRLENEGLVTRVPDAHDGRVSYVRLTAEGKRLAAQSQSDALQKWQEAIGRLDVDVEAATRVVGELLEALEHLTGARLGRDLGI